jgi:S-adenosylmethionine:tRNA ribosyltransferase-isomerase
LQSKSVTLGKLAGIVRWSSALSSNLSHYDYELPKQLIAQEPLPNRADARLMVVDRNRQSIEHWHVRDLPEILRRGDCLVVNNTRVVPARIVGVRENTGGRWEGLFLTVEPTGAWQILCKARGKLVPGEMIQLQDRSAAADTQLRLVAKSEEGIWLARPISEESPWDLLDRVGRVPLPKYIRKGEMLDGDAERYQTVFAQHRGSAAAPTAGLHFSPDLFKRLDEQKIGVTKVTLHVGIGTFQPIKAEQLEKHIMHREWGQISEATVAKLQQTRQTGGRIVAVGTTSVRVLETAAADSLLRPWEGETQLFIRPPYRFKAIDALMTNFHLPRSTLLVLVRTFGGDELIRRAYDDAIKQEYRFFSYGDAMLIV